MTDMRQVPGPDAAFLYGEQPEWHFHVSALMLADPATSDRFTTEEVVDQLRRRLHLVPQFRWKLMEGPLGLRLERPVWIDDPDFVLDHHVHRVAVPSPGDREALGNLVGRLVSFKLVRTRPLWELWIIEGLADGKVALLMKVHHSIIDGQSGAEVASLLYDLEARPEPLPEPPPYRPEPPPHVGDWLALTAKNATAWPWRASRYGVQLVRHGITFGRHVLGDEPPAAPLQAPRTPLNGNLTPDRAFASAAVTLEDVKKVKDSFDVTVNDVVLAVSAGALRSYLEDIDVVPDRPLVAQVPVSLRDAHSRDQVGTKVGAMFCSLATHIDDPVARLRAIHESSTRGKQMRQEITDQSDVNLTDTLAPAVLTVAARAWCAAGLDAKVPPIFNLIVSNVAGPPFDLYCAGARITALYPMGPLLAGTGVNFTAVSSAERVDFGLLACPSLVSNPWDIANRIPDALGELVASL